MNNNESEHPQDARFSVVDNNKEICYNLPKGEIMNVYT
jgi:hypothetical protein